MTSGIEAETAAYAGPRNDVIGLTCGEEFQQGALLAGRGSRLDLERPRLRRRPRRAASWRAGPPAGHDPTTGDRVRVQPSGGEKPMRNNVDMSSPDLIAYSTHSFVWGRCPMRTRLTSMAIALAAAFGSAALATAPQATVAQWEVFELEMTAERQPANPYVDGLRRTVADGDL
jgi:hypothetical protein